ncbi:YwqI/YxiC family protein [Bacillus sp. FJAT-47783]|uniref:YwqI/YxiC family protein n=1 Tax=Bacillus sp. FJAT-47783 TaxID=2922712 RepID=UPI001FAE26BF|nr:YwqI/YxiC family protein [Bacillus sp. FJAT-47783]
MATIKLDYETVMSHLNDIERAIEKLTFPSLPEESVGNNKLNFTKKWIEREHEIHQLVSQYKEAVVKNVEDTKANVNLLKEQDQAMVKN